MKLGALEAGGTKMVCAIGDETGKIYEQVSIATTTPEETIPKLIAYFQDKQIDALGIASFGPVELDPKHRKNMDILLPHLNLHGQTLIFWEA